VETKGSTYRRPGARMLITPSGDFIGVLSGGCLEDDIVRHAREIIDGAPPILLEFDTRRLYGCNGRVRIFVERVTPAGAGGNFLTALGEELDRRQLCRLRTCYEEGPLGTTLLGPVELVPERKGVLIHCVPLPVRLLLFGAGPEIAPVQQIAETLGWVHHHFVHPSEFPGELQPDVQTCALVMMHHFGRDLAVLDRLLPLRLPYVALLGPRKRYWQLLQELHARPAFDPECLLDIGSEAPEEIALSVMSEVSAVLADRHGGHLRDRATAIHLAAEPLTAHVA
jgi:xanthine dehydrogenase accessory factor